MDIDQHYHKVTDACVDVGWWRLWHISTLIGYLMPNPAYTYIRFVNKIVCDIISK